MLYMASDSPKLLRLQGCFVSDTEIHNLVNFWRGSLAAPTRQKTASTEAEIDPKLPWADILAEAERDDMLEEAIKLVTETGRASTSMLQRRLGIGYPRASRLMDQLEAEGIIGPAEGSKPREVLGNWESEADYDDFDDDLPG
jgi:S-DNA-T family DNA segregation ATPase FtsK/SpoIIIE